MGRKSNNKATIQFNHTAAVDVAALSVVGAGIGGDSEAIDNLLQDLTNDSVGEVIEVLESTEGDSVVAVESSAGAAVIERHDDATLDAAVEDAARIEARQEVYEGQAGDPEVSDSATPATPPEAMVDPAVDKAAKKEAKKKEREAAKAKKNAEKAAAKAAKPVKPARATSVTHTPGKLLVAKLGSEWREYVTFSITAADGDAAELAKAQDDFVARMDDKEAIADKVREKIIMLLTWLKAGGDLNEVLKRTFQVLNDKGELTSGDKGNLQLNLLSKPYSVGTARSQANQMFMALPELGITVKEKGRMVANPDSVLLPMINNRLGLK
jgi:hypothetical protein